jgi:hypothetical protein
MATGPRGPSATPLPTKLGIREGSRLLVIGAPEGFDAALAPMPAGVRRLARAGSDLDVVLVFALRRAELRRRLPRLVAAIAPAGGLWVAWPKRAARVTTDLTFEVVQAMGLAAGLVDNKSASITEVFQGLRFVYRLRDRP